jgi:N-acetylglucosaminyl-diphospho-decaprenol L-rhamnosyltransferase
MTAQADLTASVVSHGQIGLVNTLIADLVRHSSPRLRRLVVTLNIPEDDPIRPADARFDILVLRNARVSGFGTNHNLAFRQCDTRWFAVLNPDLRFSDDALGLLLAACEPQDGLIAPLILDAEGHPADAARRLPTPLLVAARRLQRRSRGPDPDFDWLAGMCLMLDAEAFRSLGGFDERYFMYCEDTDLCLRMQLAGWSVRQVPSVRIVHEARRESRRSVRYLRWHVTSLIRLWTSPVFWAYVRQRNELGLLRRTGLDCRRLQSR